MPSRNIIVSRPSGGPAAQVSAALDARFEAIRRDLEVPDAFPPEVLAAAEEAARSVVLPERDETAVPFLTIDPPGSMDLDQAMHLSREGDGYRVRYAIADVPAFVTAGGAVDAEARRRGETVYAPDRRTPLHPPVLGEGAASLLPGEVRPAFVWDLRLDAGGERLRTELYLARVRSVDRLDYAGVQQQLDGGTDDERLLLLAEVGERLVAQERKRGGASLPLPEQDVTAEPDGTYRLSFRPLLPVEDWNAQISLLTGMAAADLMLDARVGILRTMPAPDDTAVRRLRNQAAALGVPWAQGQPYGEFLRSLDRTQPRQLALIHDATSLFRGAGYTPLDGSVPQQTEHAAVGAPYAHVTAPLRRLVDRFGLAVCEALCRGAEVPDWAREALPQLPQLMAGADRRANGVERECADAVEAAVLGPHVGEVFDAVVVERSDRGGLVVQLTEPAVVAKAEGEAPEGVAVRVRLEEATIATGTVRFSVVA